jgi:hypothetical protein
MAVTWGKVWQIKNKSANSENLKDPLAVCTQLNRILQEKLMFEKSTTCIIAKGAEPWEYSGCETVTDNSMGFKTLQGEE